jgi:carboxymethylenebutenolidase
MKTETLQFNTANGASTAYIAAPDDADENTKAVILIQEYWGLTDHIKDVANRYADEGFIAIAPDLYRGKLAKDPEEAGKMMQGLAIEDGLNTIDSAMNKARETYNLHHFGITGYCMGGTYALRAACKLEGISAAAPFYGDIPEEEVLKNLNAPTIFVSGIHDKWINPEKVATLENIADKYELPIETLKYDADHAFFNNTRPEVYNEAAAKDAWAKVIGFFNDKL